MADTKIPFEKLKTEASTDQLLGFNGSGIPTLFNQSDFNNDSAFATEDLTGGDNADKMIIEDQTDGLQKFITLGALGTLIGGGGGGAKVLQTITQLGAGATAITTIGPEEEIIVVMTAAGGSGADGVTPGTAGGDATFGLATAQYIIGGGGGGSITTGIAAGGVVTTPPSPYSEITGQIILRGQVGGAAHDATGTGNPSLVLAGPQSFIGEPGAGGEGTSVTNGQGGGPGGAAATLVLFLKPPFTNAPYPISIPSVTTGSGNAGSGGRCYVFRYWS